jgi:hypothetical protein
MQVPGNVQVRTANIYRATKQSIQDLDLENRMRYNNAKPTLGGCKPGELLDWEWEGGMALHNDLQRL